MRQTKFVLLTLLMMLCSGLCSPIITAVVAKERGVEERSAEQQRQADAIAAELPHLISGEKSLDSVRFELAWLGRFVILHGDGVGFWNHTWQFRVPKSVVVELLKEVQAAKLTSMKLAYNTPIITPDLGPDPGPFPTSYLRLSIGDLEVGTKQFPTSEPHPELAALAKKLLQTGEDAVAEKHVEATSLQDGLEKIVDGSLAPAALKLHVYRVEKHTSEIPTDEVINSWILRIQGRRATWQPSFKNGFGEEIHVQLSDMQLHELHTTLAAARPDAFQKKLHADFYTDFSVQVMQRKTVVKAGPYKEITPAPNAKSQENFTEVYSMLERIKERIETAHAKREEKSAQ